MQLNYSLLSKLKAAIQLKFGRKTSRLTCGVYIIKATTLSKANLTP